MHNNERSDDHVASITCYNLQSTCSCPMRTWHVRERILTWHTWTCSSSTQYGDDTWHNLKIIPIYGLHSIGAHMVKSWSFNHIFGLRFGRTNPYTRSFLVGCLNPYFQETSVRVVSPQPLVWVRTYRFHAIFVFPMGADSVLHVREYYLLAFVNMPFAPSTTPEVCGDVGLVFHFAASLNLRDQQVKWIVHWSYIAYWKLEVNFHT